MQVPADLLQGDGSSPMNFKHLRNVMTWCDPSQFTDDEIIGEFSGDLTRTMVQERLEREEVISNQSGMTVRVDREA